MAITSSPKQLQLCNSSAPDQIDHCIAHRIRVNSISRGIPFATSMQVTSCDQRSARAKQIISNGQHNIEQGSRCCLGGLFTNTSRRDCLWRVLPPSSELQVFEQWQLCPLVSGDHVKFRYSPCSPASNWFGEKIHDCGGQRETLRLTSKTS